MEFERVGNRFLTLPQRTRCGDRTSCRAAVVPEKSSPLPGGQRRRVSFRAALVFRGFFFLALLRGLGVGLFSGGLGLLLAARGFGLHRLGVGLFAFAGGRFRLFALGRLFEELLGIRLCPRLFFFLLAARDGEALARRLALR